MAAIAFVLSLALPISAAAQTAWIGSIGDWFATGNWSAGVPDASADARIDNGGTSQLASGNAAARSIILGFDTTDTGVLTAAGSTLDVAADLSVGYGGTGTLAISGGAVISDYSGEIGYTIASGSGVHGDVTVDGAGSAWNNTYELYVGYGVGTLTVTDGASVSDYYGYLGYYPEFPGHSSGTATIDGAGSIWTSGASLHVGDSGTGILGVTNGGTVVSGEGDLGFNVGSDGTATIDGSGSSWTANGFFYVGNGGDGVLHVAQGGAMNSLGAFGYIAFDASSTSSATIDGAGSMWSNANGLYVGFGGDGSLSITDGGVVENGSFVNVGFSPGATGTLTVSGLGSTFASDGALSIGGNVGGAGGTGALQIDDGGAISASAVNVWNTGTIELAGAHIDTSTLTIDGGNLNANAGGASMGGNLVLGPMTTSSWSVPADGAASIAVAGSATLDGALVVDLDSNLAAGQYTLLEADDGFNGSAFATVSVVPPGPDLTVQVTYDANHVYLVLVSDVLFRNGFEPP